MSGTQFLLFTLGMVSLGCTIGLGFGGSVIAAGIFLVAAAVFIVAAILSFQL